MSAITLNETYTQELDNWVSQKKAAVNLINSIGQLMYDRNVELVLFRNPLLEVGVSEILDLHEYARKMVNKPIDISTTATIANELLNLELAPSKLDVGRLASEWMKEKDRYTSVSKFLNDKLSNIIGHQSSSDIRPRDVVLYGFGRIGRLCARELINMAGKGQQLRLRAIVSRPSKSDQLEKRASLLKMDSVHGPFKGVIDTDSENKRLIVNGQIIEMIEANSPDSIDYESYGINDALVIDNTGAFRDDVALGLHLKAKGVNKALLTAPGKNMPNIVYGVNHNDFNLDSTSLWSAASCTTNAIVPILKVINDLLGIEKGHIETVHAYTNDQNLLDNMHSKHRRGRSAAINMVITETGAGKAVSLVIPDLKGKLTANAVRVPVPNGSLAIMNLTVDKKTDIDEVNSIMKKAALQGELVNQIRYSLEEELVSNDIIGNTCCSVFDSPATIVAPDGKSIVLYVWYDNEFGYTKQVLRLAKHIAKVRRLIYY